MSSGTRLSAVSRKRVPMATPSAPQASAATRPRPSWKPPAPSTGTAWPTASTTWGRSSEVGTVPVWPPPSPPWAMTASTPKSSIFSAWRRAPTVGMTSTPASCSRATASLVGAPAKLTRRTPPATHRSMRAARSGWSARRFTPNGASVRSLTPAMAATSWSSVIVTAARTPNPPAALVAAVSVAHRPDLVQQGGQALGRQHAVVGVGLQQVEPLGRRVRPGPGDVAVHRIAEVEPDRDGVGPPRTGQPPARGQPADVGLEPPVHVVDGGAQRRVVALVARVPPQGQPTAGPQ